ncbi:MAG: hypothetical protein PHR53_05965, partial [Bacteroidales bacterium]|nr:hypothetical protein [Bacteroidales bacterium]
MNENNCQHFFADWCLNQWKKRKKVIIFFFSSKVVWTLAIFVVFYFCTDLMFGNLLKKIIEKSTNYTYTFEYNT